MTIWDWTARIKFDKYELGQNFSIIIFLGKVPENPMDWLVSPDFVGAHDAFVHGPVGKILSSTKALYIFPNR